MHRTLSALTPSGFGRVSARMLRLAFGIAACASLVFAGPVPADEEAPATDAPAEVVVTEAPPPPPPPPTDPPPPPAPTDPPPPPPPTDPPPTLAPEPTLAPTTPPTAVPPTGIPATPPLVLPTTEPTATPAPTETPTPTPTATPEPALTYALAGQPECTLVPDQAPAIASGGSLDYACTSTLALDGTHIVPANVAVAWNTRATVDGGWSVQILPPVNDPADHVEWTPAGLSEARFTFDQIDPAGTATDAGVLDTSTAIAYRLRIHRLACGVDPQTVLLHHEVTVQSPDAAAEPQVQPVANPEPLRLTPGLAPIPDPVVAFDGPLDFGEVGVTAQGPTETVKQGTLAVVVSNLDHTCGDWTLRVSATALTDEGDAPLDGAHLVVVSIDNEPLPDGGCDLAAGCDLATLTGNPGGASTQTLTLGVELRMPEQPGLGAFQTSLTAALQPAAADS